MREKVELRRGSSVGWQIRRGSIGVDERTRWSQDRHLGSAIVLVVRHVGVRATRVCVVACADSSCLPPRVSAHQVTLTGHEGGHKQFMGVYKLSAERANNAVLYVKDEGGGVKHYLYRGDGSRDDEATAQRNGKWMVTDDESSIAENRGFVMSSKAAYLPSGLKWQTNTGPNRAWIDDPNIRCTAVRPPHDMSPRTHTRTSRLLAPPLLLAPPPPVGLCRSNRSYHNFTFADTTVLCSMRRVRRRPQRGSRSKRPSARGWRPSTPMRRPRYV